MRRARTANSSSPRIPTSDVARRNHLTKVDFRKERKDIHRTQLSDVHDQTRRERYSELRSVSAPVNSFVCEGRGGGKLVQFLKTGNESQKSELKRVPQILDTARKSQTNL